MGHSDDIKNKVVPAFEGCDKCIVFSTNNAFIPCLSVMLQSIIDNSNEKNNYDIIILHQNVNEFSKKCIIELANGYFNISIRFFDVSNYIDGVYFYTENRKNFTSEAYFRLLIPWILDENYKLAAYLDCDMIVMGDLFDIFEKDLNNNLIAAVRDYWGICNCYIPGDRKRSYRENIGLYNIDDYIISGTILFNLNAFRETLSLDQVIDMITSREWEQHDQDVINVLCKNRIEFLSPKWGWMSDYGNNHYLPQHLQDELAEIEDIPVVVHFGGGRKPWLKTYAIYDMDFWKYALKTPYFSYLLNKVKSLEYKSYVAYHCSNGNYDFLYDENGKERYLKNVYLGNLSAGHTRYRVIKIKNNILHLEGMVAFFSISLDSSIDIFLKVNGEKFSVKEQHCENGYNKERNLYTYRGESFIFEYELNTDIKDYEIEIICIVDGVEIAKRNLGFEKYSPLSRTFKESYYSKEKWMVTTDEKVLYIALVNKDIVRKKETAFCKELKDSNKVGVKKALFVRWAVKRIKKVLKKPIWIVSDRVSKADDNGEAFFRYLNAEHKKDVHSFFVISKNSSDYKRLKHYGHVIPPYSYRHKLLHLLASCSISSQTDEVFKNPLHGVHDLYRDIVCDVDFVFLQHGIIVTDLTDWLCRRRQSLSGFVTTTEKEYNLILNDDYGYTEQEIWLTGLPRFDLLHDAPERYITIIPTWRKYLATHQDPETGIWNLKESFSESEYVKFYRSLMQNELLQSKAKELGYTLQFKIHPSFLAHESEFGFEANVRIILNNESYRDIYQKSNLIITDYSSVIYDFIYLRKPIIYCQFDKDEFFGGNHICNKGKFDYENEGFGEVETNVEDTVKRIIEYMENNCKLKDKYRERIDDFFTYNDRNNCQRVYEKILELED